MPRIIKTNGTTLLMDDFGVMREIGPEEVINPFLEVVDLDENIIPNLHYDDTLAEQLINLDTEINRNWVYTEQPQPTPENGQNEVPIENQFIPTPESFFERMLTNEAIRQEVTAKRIKTNRVTANTNSYFGTVSKSYFSYDDEEIIKKPKDRRSIDIDQLKGFLTSVLDQREIVLGKSMMLKLKRMKDPIADFISDLHTNLEVLNIDFSYIDASTEEGYVTFLPTKKKDVGDEKMVWRHPSRQKTKIGRLLTVIANEKGISFTQTQIDAFIAKFKAIQKSDDSEELDFADWKVFKGEELIKWYNGRNYHPSLDGGDTLNKSCMRYDKCADYLHVYTHSPMITLITLINKVNGKLMGRALVWQDINIDGEKATFMDRIYVVESPLEELFKLYAEKRGWWYKIAQNAKPYTPITNGTIVKNAKIEAWIANDVNWSDYKNVHVPYMDSLKFFKYFKDSDGKNIPRLTNDENDRWEDNWSYNHGGYCLECDGSGQYHVADDETVPCEYCKGTGRR